MLKPVRNHDNVESIKRYMMVKNKKNHINNMICFMHIYSWNLLFVGEYFIQDKQAKINRIVAEYERTQVGEYL